MGGPIGQHSPCARGPIPRCLDVCSRGDGARTRLEQLKGAISALKGAYYRGLETVFEQHLLRLQYADPNVRRIITDNLRKHWFDETSGDAYFSGQKVAEHYAEGVIEALNLSLAGKPDPIPINTWWVIVEQQKVKLLALGQDDAVTLLIMTPRPQSDDPAATLILGKEGQAWVTQEDPKDGRIIARKVENPPRRP
jgi:hypothetical protein